MRRLHVDIWSDIACPWCYVGKRRLELALEQFPHREQVEVLWHAFELDPRAPRELDPSLSHAEWLASKYRSSVETAQRRIAQLTELAHRDGLDFRFDRIRSGNTFDAHRLVRLALTRGVQGAMKERLMRGYLSEGEPIGRREALARMAADVGLDGDEVSATLESERFAAEVRDDERQARELGISGVPFFVLGGRYAISGAQPPELLRSALETAWGELEPAQPTPEDGPVCGPDGC